MAKYIAVGFMVLALVGNAWAGAWVLWQHDFNHVRSNSVDGGYKNEWHLLIAYPENGYQSCVNAAEKKVETTVALWRELYSSTGNISIKDDGQTVKYTSNYPGDGFDSRRFVCLPDTINPKIKQIK